MSAKAVQIFCTNVVPAAFSSYILALAKNLYEKRVQKTLMKLTEARKICKKHLLDKIVFKHVSLWTKN